MGKDKHADWFAILNGRDGPQIYDNKCDFENAKAGCTGICHRTFPNYNSALNWLRREAGPAALVKLAKGHPPPIKYTPTAPLTPQVSVSSLDDNAPPSKDPPEDPLEIEDAIPTSDTSPPPVVAQLTPEQKKVLSLAMSGRNVFFTGPAGTGKSFLLREIVRSLKSMGKIVAVTATTGIAALNIQGRTVHSFAGVRLSNPSIKKLVDKILNDTTKSEGNLKDRWTLTDVLIIDEISMMDGRLFDKLQSIARFVRNKPKPFGGMQLILSGDFYRLPPVEDKSYKFTMPSMLAFEARFWDSCVDDIIFLKRVFRQNDNAFLSVLGAMRRGQLTFEHIQCLRSLSRPLVYEGGIEPVYLFPKRDRANACNFDRLAALPGSEVVFTAHDRIGYDYDGNPIPEKDAKELLERLTAQPYLTLKIDAQVMLLKNVVQGCLVNGSIGKVEEFVTVHDAMARAIRIACPQTAEVDEQYANSMLKELTESNIISKGEKYPLVLFENGRQLLCAPLEFVAEGFMGNIEVHRYQVPLALAWAMSIHKSQVGPWNGSRLIWEKPYVAVSRARSMDTLQIVDFDPGKVMVHPKVLKWERDLERSMAIDFENEMDTDEASRSFWQNSQL